MNTKRILFSIIAVLVLSGLGYWGYLEFLAPGENTGVAAPDVDGQSDTTPSRSRISAEGQIVPLAQAQLAFERSGVVLAIVVSAGDLVTEGDTLLILDSAEHQIALRQAEAMLAQAEGNLELAVAEVLAAETAVLAAVSEVSAAEARFALLDVGPRPEQIVLKEQLVGAAEANVALALGNQGLLLEGSPTAQIRAAEAALATAEAAYASVVRLYQPVAQDESAPAEDRHQAQLQLNAASANLAAAQTKLAELVGGPTPAERSAAAGAVAAAENRQMVAEAELALLLAGSQPEQLAVAQAEITVAQELLAEVELQIAQAEAGVVQAEAAVSEAAAQVAAAQLALEKSVLRSPFNGVVADILIAQSETVLAGQPVAIVADFSQWRVETTDLVEADVVGIAREGVANVAVDAFAGELFTARVLEIAQNSSEVRGEVAYRVTLSLANPNDLALRWGMATFVTFEN